MSPGPFVERTIYKNRGHADFDPPANFAIPGRPASLAAADANDDGQIDTSAAVAILSFLFLGENTIPLPMGACAGDPTEDNLPCDQSPLCPG